ncbi:MAG: UPF0280 family protein [Candidatus Nezhaarchaeales archaeon]
MLPIHYARGLYRVRMVIGYSNLLVISEKLEAVRAAFNAISYHGEVLERYVQHNPLFKLSLTPVRVGWNAPYVARLAAEAAEIAGVGPMAAVPGALAEVAAVSMVKSGAKVAVVEDGGEIAAISIRPINVGVYAGSSPLSGRLGFKLEAADTPIGIATSSATVSKAINFGVADAAVAIADSAALADAAAKAICNAVIGDEAEEAVQRGLEAADEINCIRGALIVKGRYVGVKGKLPKLVAISGPLNELFKSVLMDTSLSPFYGV